MVRIGIDTMSGDFGSKPLIKGTLLALRKNKTFIAVLIGDKTEISSQIPKRYLKRVEIIHTNDIITMTDKVDKNLLKRKDSSTYKTIELLNDGTIDVAITPGNTGAVVFLSNLIIKRVKGVSRAPLGTLIPTINSNKSMVLDVGANSQVTKSHLLCFARLGNIYMDKIYGIKPKIGILSNGEEDHKGDTLTKESFPILESHFNEQFLGNVEPSDIFNGGSERSSSNALVTVCSGFVGNIFLKTAESSTAALKTLIKDNLKNKIFAKIGSILMIRVFKAISSLSKEAVGSVPLIGLKKNILIAHGSANAMSITSGIMQAIHIHNSNLQSTIEEEFKNEVEEN